MNCKECGRQIPDGALFCKYCGAQVEKQAAETEDVAAPIQHPRRRAKKKRGPKPAAILAVVLILAAGVAAGVLIWKNSGQTPGSDAPPAEVQAPAVTASISPRNSQVEVWYSARNSRTRYRHRKASPGRAVTLLSPPSRTVSSGASRRGKYRSPPS